ncbi:glycosyltransferase [Maritimibacter sp. DP07]|uniref:Glycosyltransferase n=1 Tax=Maritimibacter harenae TaxID=2606218 RepID=A0A845M0I6_9RHOB|nr:glycosyltransferase [Maritimibacter harenae]MZR13830.1 glycosyltransferase [Maritimibacter harenae]
MTETSDKMPDNATSRPLVTFLLISYNQEDYIRSAVEGAFAQNYEPLEIILSDDCSNDRTFDILKELAESYDGPHRVHVRQNTKNSGTLRHLQLAVDEAKGAFIVLAAGDDVSRPNRVEKLYDAWSSQGSWAIFSDFADIDYTGKVTKEHSKFEAIGEKRHGLASYIKGRTKEHNIVHGATSAYDRRVFEYITLPEDDYILAEDGALSLLLHILDKDVTYIGAPLVEYRKHDYSLTNSTRRRLSWSKLIKAEETIAMYARSSSNRCAFILESHRRMNQGEEPRIDIELIKRDMNNQRLVANWWNMNSQQRLMALPKMERTLLRWAFPRLMPRRLFLAFKFMAGYFRQKDAKQ